jgi:hypothetical protein
MPYLPERPHRRLDQLCTRAARAPRSGKHSYMLLAAKLKYYCRSLTGSSAFAFRKWSVHSHRGIKCLEQSGIAEWLEQALYRTLFDESRTNTLISAGSNKNNRNVATATF